MFEECLSNRLDVKWSHTIVQSMSRPNIERFYKSPEVGTEMSGLTNYTLMMDVITRMAAEEEAVEKNGMTPPFAPVPNHPFSNELPRREVQPLEKTASVSFAPPPSTALPTSLSTDDASVQVNLFNLQMNRRPPKTARTTLVSTPSLVDSTMQERRVAQIDQVMHDLESTPGFWNNVELLLQDSWLNGYRGTFFEQKEDFAGASKCYERALKLYAIALKLDRLTAKSSPHIVSYYYLLKRYANVLCDSRLPQEFVDMRIVSRVHDQLEIIRTEREKWGMKNIELEDEPFTYAGTILKVLCL